MPKCMGCVGVKGYCEGGVCMALQGHASLPATPCLWTSTHGTHGWGSAIGSEL